MMSKYILTISICLVLTRGIEFKLEDSLDYLMYQKASYCNIDNIANWQCGSACKYHPEMKNIEVFSNQKYYTQGFIGYNNDQIIIAFRGSTISFANWKNNLDFQKISYDNCSGCKVHKGFYASYNSIKPSFFHKLEKMILQYPNSQIIITGHSLGGVFATLAAIDIQNFLKQKDYYNIIKEVHTFGSPRVGNQAFVQYYNTLLPQTIRIVQNNDIVTNFPPYLLGYSHVGTEIWFSKSFKEYKICQPFQEDNTCSKSKLRLNFLDHINYLNNNTGCRNPNRKINCLNGSNNDNCK